MEGIRIERRNQGIYEGGNLSSNSLDSRASLHAHAVAPAGSRFVEGTPAVPQGRNPFESGRPEPAPLEGGSPESETPAPSPGPKIPFYKKRWFIISQIILIPLAIVLLFVLLFPVVRAIVQLVVNRSRLNIQVATINVPTNGSFELQLDGFVSNTGIFSATIQFQEPIDVFWLEDGRDEPQRLGLMTLDEPLRAAHKRAPLNHISNFTIMDEDTFGRFAGVMITGKNFTWRLQSNNLRVQAMKFPVAKGIKFNQDVTLNGFQNFNGGIVLKDFQLPSDNPAGGINFVAVTELENPSPFSLNLGTVVFELSYESVVLGNATAANTIITNGTNEITLKGVLEPHSEPSELATLSKLFTNYLNGEVSPVVATGLSTLQEDGSEISWLSTGLQALHLDVPFKAFVPIDPIRSISIGQFALEFSEENPWAPVASSSSVTADLQLPFGFNISIGHIQNDFNITTSEGHTVAGLSTPLGASISSITVLSSTNTVGAINITIADSPLHCPVEDRETFSLFNANLTNSEVAEFRLQGKSHVIANMSIGQITLDPIKVNVTTSLQGLQGLKGMTTIESVDVIGGTTAGINLAIDVNIFNPSNLNLEVGDLTLQLRRDNIVLGTVLLPNLTLAIGNNSVSTISTFDANASAEGRDTLNQFIAQQDVQLTIAGFSGSTNIEALRVAFETLSLNVTLPGLKTKLLQSASLQILPTTGRTNDISRVTVDLVNPFSAPFDITGITSTVQTFGIQLGTIKTATNFRSLPNSTTTSPPLDLNMNFDPASLFTVTRELAINAGMSTVALDGIVALGGIQYLRTTGVPPALGPRQADVFAGFNLPMFIQGAFERLESDVTLQSTVSIGDYETTLDLVQAGVPVHTDDTLDLILPVLAQPIVQQIVSGTQLVIESVLILDPKAQSFNTQLVGSITSAGPFDAVINFPNGLTVSWQGQSLGNIEMQPVSVAGDVGATLNTSTSFQISDLQHITSFTRTLLTDESFDWEISGSGITVSALGISVTGITLPSKRVNLKGFNGLNGGVQIKTFDLPDDDPKGGIKLTLDVTTKNPSQVGVQLSSINFDTSVGNEMIASVGTLGGVTLAPGASTDLALLGTLIPQTTDGGLAAVSEVFNNFIAGKDSNVTVRGASAGPSDVTWLNEGIKSLQVVTALPNRGPQSLIKSIALNELSLVFTEATAYDPKASSNDTAAQFDLPFGFSVDIKNLDQKIRVGYQGKDLATLDIPRGDVVTDVASRKIALTFNAVPFSVPFTAENDFNKFVSETTVGGLQALRLAGSANAGVMTSVGFLSLNNLNFDLNSGINGLEGLTKKPVEVGELDVNKGTDKYLLIKVASGLFNPSKLTIGTGDVSFDLLFQNKKIGSADLSSLTIQPGDANYAIDILFAPEGDDATAAGQLLLENYLQGVISNTTIKGSLSSTRIPSLKEGLSKILLEPVPVRPLNQTLIRSTSLVFPVDIVQTGNATSSFVLSNPFTASINLHRVTAVATFQNLILGKIDDVDLSANPIHADGHNVITSQELPLQFNLDPTSIIALLKIKSQENGVDLGPLEGLFQFILDNPDFKPPVTTRVDLDTPVCLSGHQFDVADAILKTLTNLAVDLDVVSSVKLDEFPTQLRFAQKGIKTITDETSLYLIGAVAGPVAQHLVDISVLNITEATISNVTNRGFDLALVGSLTNTGPLDAQIEFVEPLDVTFQGNRIATITLPPVCAAADDGVPDYRAKAHVIITQQDKFTEFATHLLHNPSFDWTISTSNLHVTALETIFQNVSLSKVITLKAFNGLPGVQIQNFNLPSDDPAGGIHIDTDVLIPSEAQIGIDLGTVGFQTFFGTTLVGPLVGGNFSLAPSAETLFHLSGRILPQSGEDRVNIGVLFSKFLAGENVTLVTKGDFVQPPGASDPVQWLSTAFKSLKLEVILPGKKYEVIQSITLNDLAVTIESQDQAFVPPTSSNFTLARYKNPFGFSLQVIAAGEDLTLYSKGVDIAELQLPMVPTEGGVSTGNIADLLISFKDQPLKALNNAAFQTMFAEVTLQDDLDIGLKGVANVTARTSIGDVDISNISFDVQSSLKGINNFGGTAALNNVTVSGSGGIDGSEYIVSPLTTILNNPSNISLSTVNIVLPVLKDGVMIGRAAINPFNFIPGDNLVSTEFHYQPEDANNTNAQAFLSEFVQTDNSIPLTISGDEASTPFASLQLALGGTNLATQLTGLNRPKLITDISVIITLDSLVTDFVSVSFNIQNPLDADLVLEYVQSDSGVNGLTYAHFSQPFDSLIVPAGQTVNSGLIPNVFLKQGALAALDIIPLGILDVQTAITARIGKGGYTIPWLKLSQMAVPTVYTLDIGFADFKAAALAHNQTTSTSHSTGSATASHTTSTSRSASSPASESASASASVSVPAPAATLDTQIKTQSPVASTIDLQSPTGATTATGVQPPDAQPQSSVAVNQTTAIASVSGATETPPS